MEIQENFSIVGKETESFPIDPAEIPLKDISIVSMTEKVSHEKLGYQSSSEDEALPKLFRKRLAQVSDRDSEVDKDNVSIKDINSPSKSTGQYINDTPSFTKSITVKHRIRSISSSSSESDGNVKSLKKKEQQVRMKNKSNKIKQKFQKLINSRAKDKDSQQSPNCVTDTINKYSDNEIASSEESSTDNSKQILKSNSGYINNVCDPDTSDEEVPRENLKKKPLKSVKLTSPKPMRITAKQAMDNMKKIKSESNRMLREKEVSLPYHKPKAISLKDIMSRRKPAVDTEGNVLGIKMKEEQLIQYALLLEQRQKEIIELCKSDSEEEHETLDENIVRNLSTTDTPEVKETSSEMCASEKENSDYVKLAITDGVDVKENIENSKTIICNTEICLNSDSLYDSMTEIKSGRHTSYSDINENELAHRCEMELNNYSTKSVNVDVLDNSLDINISDMVKETAVSVTECEKEYEDEVQEFDNDCINTKMGTIIPTQDVTMESISQSVTENETNILFCEQDFSEKEIQSNTNPIHEITNENKTDINMNENLKTLTNNTESDSQLVSLHYYSEKCVKENSEEAILKGISVSDAICEDNDCNDFPDDDFNIEDIDKIIENAEIIRNVNTEDNINSPMLIMNLRGITNSQPKLTGGPGIVIDLDGPDAKAMKKLSGVELLKERFTYFAKLKTPEQTARGREKKIKPGTLHLKLKQELEEKIAEQQVVEWEKRLEEEKQQQIESNAVLGNSSDLEEDLDKIEAKLEKNENLKEKEDISESDAETEPEEDDVYIRDKPRKKNPLINDQAEESDEGMDENGLNHVTNDIEDSDNDADESSEEDSTDSETEETVKLKKGRILKAFEDSDDENLPNNDSEILPVNRTKKIVLTNEIINNDVTDHNENVQSQDEELQLGQRHKSLSEDLFSTQESTSLINKENTDAKPLGTQTFSSLDLGNPKEYDMQIDLNIPKGLSIICDTVDDHNASLDDVVDMSSRSFSTEHLVPVPSQIQTTQSQDFGDDVLALCTGKFYDNQFVSQLDDNSTKNIEVNNLEIFNLSKSSNVEKSKLEDNVDKDIINEFNDSEFDIPKPNKFFFDNNCSDNLKKREINNLVKKKLVIDSDEEEDKVNERAGIKNKQKKSRKKKPEQRALQISDDEEEESLLEESEEEDNSAMDNNEDRIVEYDSEENEVLILPEKKKKRKMADFFEQEAELTSEDEWVGSGDEDEAGLDRMEREEGDDEVFHQGKLQRELGEIHMRDVLDQDKREVRLLQELLFEDGDLGDGHRQRKFRWKNADGKEATGTLPDELLDTQEDEFESEEQWRKQRHEREVFLREMKNRNEPENSPVTLNRSTIIKANLCSKTMSSLLMEANTSTAEKTEIPAMEKKTTKDIPSPKKPYAVFQQSFHGSLLSRGQTALARLAALATPLATDNEAKVGSLPPSSKRNFVFASLTEGDEEPKPVKRKAEKCVDTPKLLKKMKIEEKKQPRNSLLDLIT